MSGKDTEKVFRYVFEFHDILIDIYKALAEKATNPTSKDLFENLVPMERQEAMRTVGDAQRLDDYLSS